MKMSDYFLHFMPPSQSCAPIAVCHMHCCMLWAEVPFAKLMFCLDLPLIWDLNDQVMCILLSMSLERDILSVFICTKDLALNMQRHHEISSYFSWQMLMQSPFWSHKRQWCRQSWVLWLNWNDFQLKLWCRGILSVQREGVRRFQ